ncbi:caspase family protein [Methylobacterium sp. 22177]|uniref:caspase family protein n=1 Tax=Methylobacterium sp. 22177 TaxID=3453885 RepID=UPI003F8627E6
MTKGISLHIGLNSVDADHYAGWSGPLLACEADAHDMKALAVSQGYEPQVLLTAEATRSAVLKQIRRSAERLQSGDIFFLTYSGHGGTVADMNGDEKTRKSQDSTWCLHDGELIDDEIYIALTDFKEGVRIFVLSDSCHSGTVLRGVLSGISEFKRFRAIPKTQQRQVFLKNKDFYEDLIANPAREGAKARVVASALLISGCQDEQTSLDGDTNGAFTAKLKSVWNDGHFKGDYRSFYQKIRDGMPSYQQPNWFPVGRNQEEFYLQKPFSIKMSAVRPSKSLNGDLANGMARAADGSRIQRLIDLGSDPASCARLREHARQAMARIYGKPTFKNACAATLSIFLREAGIDVPLEYGAGRLARILERDRGWQRIPVGKQQAGDVAVTEDNGPPAGSDHVFLVVERLGSDKMLIADNQTNKCPHTRYASGSDGRTAVQYFLRAPGYPTSKAKDKEDDIDYQDEDFIYQDGETNDLVVRYDEKGIPLQ